jgi:cell division protein FtsI (penicillin-binding protein 3)
MVERRLTWLAAILLLWGAAVALKLFSLQIFQHGYYARAAKDRQELLVELPGPRGTMFDRAGRVLAMSTPSDSVFVNPQKVDAQVAAGLFSEILTLDRNELLETITRERNRGRGFLWIKRRISPRESQRLRSLKLGWILMEPETQRHYPKGQLAAHVLGSVDFEEKGTAGIERALDEELRGIPGTMRLLTDVKRRGIASELETEAKPGASLTLSIDERIQYVAEQQLAIAVEAKNAISGSVVVMDPYRGDILALASFPTYDPNGAPQPGESPIARRNHAVSVPFEPGSVFKVVTLSAALETTPLTPDSIINCHGGVIKLPGRVIHDSHLGLGLLPMAMVLAKSSNVGAIEVGTRVGKQNMNAYVRAFGFGQKTGIPLPAESAGKFRKPERWGTTSLASISMGQEVSVTTVQLAQAASMIANGGLLVRPRLVIRKNGEPVPQVAAERVLKAENAITMRQMMEGVVLHGTGGSARLKGYTVGGKTGSAQIFDTATHRYTHSYNGTFMGFAPLTNPSVVIVVTLNGTHGNGGFGGAAAGPVFQVIATEALRVLDVPKDLPEELPATLIAKAGAIIADLADADGADAEPNILEEEDDDPTGPVQIAGAGVVLVPNFKGMTMDAAIAAAARQQLTIAPSGTGVARLQTPPPGAVLHPGERIRVEFSR